MTYLEYLDLLLAFLAQVPWPWFMAGVIAGVTLGAVIIILAIVAVANEDVRREDARRRDIYHESYVRGIYTGGSHEI